MLERGRWQAHKVCARAVHALARGRRLCYLIGLGHVQHLDVFRELKVRYFEVRGRAAWQVYKQQPVDLFPVLVHDNEVGEAALARILCNLLHSVALQQAGCE